MGQPFEATMKCNAKSDACASCVFLGCGCVACPWSLVKAQHFAGGKPLDEGALAVGAVRVELRLWRWHLQHQSQTNLGALQAGSCKCVAIQTDLTLPLCARQSPVLTKPSTHIPAGPAQIWVARVDVGRAGLQVGVGDDAACRGSQGLREVVSRCGVHSGSISSGMPLRKHKEKAGRHSSIYHGP